MPELFKNSSYIRSLKSADFPDLGSKLYEAIADAVNRVNTVAQQTNSNPTGQPIAPPAVSSVNVTGQDGYAHVAITDNAPTGLFRGIQYYIEHSDNPHFTDPHIVSIGPSRNASIAIGNQTRYFRVYSSYGSSAPSAAVYHGSQVAPTAVNGGGSGPGPAFLKSQGSGTGTPGQGLTGQGITPFRSATGAPPTRGE